MAAEINKKNIKSFIQGNFLYYLDKIIDLPQHLKEQYYYRLWVCKDDCLVTGYCKMCTCPVEKKAFAPDSCNPDLFPDFMPGSKWEEFKQRKQINNIHEIITEIENELKQK